MSFIQMSPEAAQAIKSELSARGVSGPVRIDLRSTGCCDASLGLCAGSLPADDLEQEVEGLTFVISRNIYQTVGEVRIDHVDETGRRGYRLTSSKPWSEWQGFGLCDIRFEDK